MNVAEITCDRIRNCYDGAGCACKYVKIDESRGIKFYDSPGERDAVRSRQAIGAMWGFAPKVFENVDLPDAGYWGFVVEHVRIANHYVPDRYKVGIVESWECYNDRYKEDRSKLFQRIQEKTGMRFYDGHMSNIAFNDADEMVMVDWGDESMSL